MTGLVAEKMQRWKTPSRFKIQNWLLNVVFVGCSSNKLRIIYLYPISVRSQWIGVLYIKVGISGLLSILALLVSKLWLLNFQWKIRVFKILDFVLKSCRWAIESCSSNQLRPNRTVSLAVYHVSEIDTNFAFLYYLSCMML